MKYKIGTNLHSSKKILKLTKIKEGLAIVYSQCIELSVNYNYGLKLQVFYE